MSDWGWVAFAYSVTYGGIILYVGFLLRRLRGARSRLDRERPPQEP
ncbi:MAG: hypothetical protein M3N51_02565 [Actinomycetota bacterium]|nr:hypothetical protein [Actinomycetota bacterium]